MLTALIAITLLVSGQTELPRDDETIYKITKLSTEEVGYGAVRESGNQVTVVWDTPWAPQRPWSTISSTIEFEPEVRALREERLQEEARKAGYVLHDTADGPRWLKIEDVKFAGRAREMATRKKTQEVPPGPQVTQAAPADAPGLITQWGPHVLILALGLGLTAFVVKTYLL